MPEDKGAYGFVQRVPVGPRRAIPAQKKIDPKIRRSQDPAEVVGTGLVVNTKDTKEN
jgi:hypothetical protein